MVYEKRMNEKYTLLCEQMEAANNGSRKGKLLEKGAREIIKQGWAGCNLRGQIVDRRVEGNEEAIPIPENPLFGTPKPKTKS